MKKWIFLFVTFLVLYSDSLRAAPKYRLAVGTMCKNEAPWLREWLEYHKLLGVEHFYIYNNDSTDHFMEVLDPYVQAGIAEVIDWNSATAPWHPVGPPKWVGFQLTAFNDCMKRALGEAEWVAIIDVDEYLVPIHGMHTLHSLLRNASKTNIGSLIYAMCEFS